MAANRGIARQPARDDATGHVAAEQKRGQSSPSDGAGERRDANPRARPKTAPPAMVRIDAGNQRDNRRGEDDDERDRRAPRHSAERARRSSRSTRRRRHRPPSQTTQHGDRDRCSARYAARGRTRGRSLIPALRRRFGGVGGVDVCGGAGFAVARSGRRWRPRRQSLAATAAACFVAAAVAVCRCSVSARRSRRGLRSVRARLLRASHRRRRLVLPRSSDSAGRLFATPGSSSGALLARRAPRGGARAISRRRRTGSASRGSACQSKVTSGFCASSARRTRVVERLAADLHVGRRAEPVEHARCAPCRGGSCRLDEVEVFVAALVAM